MHKLDRRLARTTAHQSSSLTCRPLFDLSYTVTFATLQAIDAVKRHHAADAVISQLIEEAPPAELAHGIDDMSPTGVLLTLMAVIVDMHMQTKCGLRQPLLDLS